MKAGFRQFPYRILPAVLLLLLSAFLALFELWRGPGWPENHEGSAMAMRVMQYIRSFHGGDFLPIWSPEENFGMGSPMALFYPRLFTLLCALPALAGIPLKAALVGILTLLGAFGEWGCFRFLRELRLPRPAAFMLCLAFPHLNYVYSDIVVRGATAEFTAMCILPWLFWWCLRLIRKGKFGYTVILIATGLFFAHTSIFVFAAPIGILALLIGYFRHRGRRRKIVETAIRSGLIIGLLIAPTLMLTALVHESYFFEFFYMLGNSPKYSFLLPATLFLGAAGRQTLPIDPQLDIAFFSMIFLGGAVVVFQMFRDPKSITACRRRRDLIAYFFVLVVFYFFLMSAWSWPIYRLFHFIFLPLQFPWRLLTYVSVLEIFGLGLILTLLRPPVPRRAPMLVATAVLIFTVGFNLARPARARIPAQEFNQERTYNWSEYIPLWSLEGFDIAGRDATTLIKMLRVECRKWIFEHSKIPPRVFGEGVRKLDIRRAKNGIDWEISYQADAPFVLDLPVIWDPLFVAVLENTDEKQLLETARLPDDPRLRIKVPAGDGVIRAIAPCWGNLIRKNLYPAAPVTSQSKD